jgi:hypothetical protein
MKTFRIFRKEWNRKNGSRIRTTIGKLSSPGKNLRHVCHGVPSKNMTPPNFPTNDILWMKDLGVGHHQKSDNSPPKGISPHTLCHHLSTICPHITQHKQWSIQEWILNQGINSELTPHIDDLVMAGMS